MINNPEEMNSFVKGMCERSLIALKPEEFEKITSTKFALAGFGGVGSIVVELLARWGVSNFRLFDKDNYELSNLNRQLFALPETLGKIKTEEAANRIKKINPYAEIEMMFSERSNAENTERFVNGADIVIQTTDQPSSLLFYKAAQKFKVPLINGYVSLKECYITFFNYHESSCSHWREKIKDYFKWRGMKYISEMSNEELDELDKKWNPGTKPSFNFITNMCGCLLVAQAFKYLTGRGNFVYYPKQIVFDCMDWKLKSRNAFPLADIANIKKMFQFITR